ncbi:MAG: tetratricopeptide repeat protein [Pseudomonadota bacterium]
MSYVRLGKMGEVPGDVTDGLRAESLTLADQALQRAPDSVMVRALWALAYQHNADPVDIYSHLSEATASADLPTMIYRGYGEILRRAGHAQDAMVIFHRLVSIDPTDATSTSRLAWLYAAEGNDRQSERYFDIAEAINPESPEYIARRRQVALWFKDGDALQTLLDEWPVSDSIDTTRSEACQQAYIRQRLVGALNKADLFEACGSYNPVWVARMLVGLGDTEGAYTLLARYNWASNPSYTINLFYPDMAPFRADPRFWTLVEDIGLVREWTDTGRWPDFCTDERHPGHCPTRS